MISNVTPAVQPAAPSQSAAQVVTREATISSDFETFLKMLTAQARYQDPLEPIDSTEYAAQLAQFSMVEQQVKTNDVLGALAGQLGAQNAASLSAWVGKEVRAETSAYFDGQPITVSAKPAPGADEAFLIVSDSEGSLKQRLPIPLSGEALDWTGLDSSGNAFETGAYNFAVESKSEGKVLNTAPAEVYVSVKEAQIDAGEVVLLMADGQRVSAQSVSALRNPV